MDLATASALWALPWAAAVGWLVVAAPRIGRLESASRLILVAVFLMIGEDAGLVFWQVDRRLAHARPAEAAVLAFLTHRGFRDLTQTRWGWRRTT